MVEKIFRPIYKTVLRDVPFTRFDLNNSKISVKNIKQRGIK